MKCFLYILPALIPFQMFGFFVPRLIHITPETLHEYPKHNVQVSGIFRSEGKYNFKIPYVKECMVYWLIICREPRSFDQRQFRWDVLWTNTLPDDIEVVARLEPNHSRASTEEQYISIDLSEEIVERAYVYKDLAYAADGGGPYYCYDLLRFLLKYKKGLQKMTYDP